MTRPEDDTSCCVAADFTFETIPWCDECGADCKCCVRRDNAPCSEIGRAASGSDYVNDYSVCTKCG